MLVSTETSVPVLQGVNLNLQAGERVALIGPSGCGKSTLLNLLAGLEKADGGSIHFDGKEVGALSRTQLAQLRRRELGVVFQFFNLFPSLTLLDNLLLPGLLDRRPLSQLRGRAQDLLNQVGLRDKSSARANELSGGELQRAAICRALLPRPKLLLADEPTGSLDSENRGRIYELLRTLSQESGSSVLMVTHDPEAAAWMDRGLLMRDGKVEPC
ncbi:MAG: ABC transporter ATP-binding protein [Deltaproteobacteria bacterium]|nr:ABC transporter ATP-binding protein [Deltaproteobacteria bacterium]